MKVICVLATKIVIVKVFPKAKIIIKKETKTRHLIIRKSPPGPTNQDHRVSFFSILVCGGQAP